MAGPVKPLKRAYDAPRRAAAAARTREAIVTAAKDAFEALGWSGATMRGIAAQAMAALGVLTGLWIALSPSFLTLQHGGGNAAVANLIAGLAVAAAGAASLAGPRGYAGLQFAAALLGVWVIISPFILDAKFSIATPMYWSNIVSGGYLMVLALAGLATVRRAAR